MSIQDIVKKLQDASDLYYSGGSSILSDKEFDDLKDKLEVLDPQNPFLFQIGAPIKGKKCKLPYNIHMGSMNKIKNDKQLNTFIDKFNGPYVISDKLDGVSVLAVYDKDSRLQLYTRGDGTYGQNITKLAKFLNLPEFNPDHLVIIRGEIIMSKKSWSEVSKLHTDLENSRNTVSGIVNTKNYDDKFQYIVSKCDLVVYEIVKQGNLAVQEKFSEQYKKLKEWGFKTVWNKVIHTVKFNTLKDELYNRSNKKYDIDGIILCDTSQERNRIKGEDMLPNGNPRYAIAFKQDTFTHAEVKDVIWEESRYGLLTPRVVLKKSVYLDGANVTTFTGFNARFVVDKKIGPGAILSVTRSGKVIPFISEVIKKSSQETPMPKNPYIWKNGSDGKPLTIYVQNETDLKQQKLIEHFLSSIHVEGFKLATIKKCYNVGMTKIKHYLQATLEDFTKVNGIKEKSGKKIFEAIQHSINNVTLKDILVGSSVFKGLGNRKIALILDNIPNLYNDIINNKDQEIRESISNINGFQNRSIDMFMTGLNKFRDFINYLPDSIHQRLLTLVNIVKTNKYKNITFVFSGVRSKELEDKIVKEGGKVTTSVSKNTDFLIVKDLLSTSSKVQKAYSLGIQIITLDKAMNII